MMDFNHIIVMITVPSKEVAEQISKTLVENNLAACVNMIAPIQSLYIWEGETAKDEEVLLIVKSTAALFEDQLIPAVQTIHPYDVPEIIALPILMGSKSYLDWIDESTSS